MGSSPLTRGKLKTPVNALMANRLIPAHAGKTRCARGATVACPAHPRSRGENIQTTVQTVVGWGSSPLTRGKRVVCAEVRLGRGLIPAHAGKTQGQRHEQPRNMAHPRSRGENQGVGRELGKVEGSSPLTRGKRCR